MTDTIRMIFTYLIDLIVIVGGMAYLYATGADTSQPTEIRYAIVGFISAAITWTFQGEIQTRTAKLQEKALMTGITSPEPKPEAPVVIDT